METHPALFCSILEAAKMLGCSRSIVYELKNAGKLRTAKLGRRSLVEIASINSFAASLLSEANHA
jgi:excisionase family DNA binding protein